VKVSLHEKKAKLPGQLFISWQPGYLTLNVWANFAKQDASSTGRKEQA